MRSHIIKSEKKPLAFLIACTDNRSFAAGNVVLSLHKYMRDVNYECIIIHTPLNQGDEKVLKSLPKVRMLPFEFPAPFIDIMLKKMPDTSRFRNKNALMTFTHFEIFKLLDEYSIVSWLDTDISIQSSIEDIVKFVPLGMTGDSPFTVRNNFSRSIEDYDMDVPGFCAAVMVVSDQLPYRAMYDWCYKKSIEHAGALINADQGIINLSFQEFGITPNLMPLEVWQCRPDRPTAITATIVHFGHIRKVWNDEVICNAFPEWYRMHRQWQKRGGSDFERSFEPASMMPALDNMKRLNAFPSSVSNISPDPSILARRLAEIENSISWRATQPFRTLLGRFPRLRRNVHRAMKVTYWIATGQLGRRYKMWRTPNSSSAVGMPNAPDDMQSFAKAAAYRAMTLCRAGRELDAAYYVAKLVAEELEANTWQLNMIFRILDVWSGAESALLIAVKERPFDPNFRDMLGLIYLEQRNLSSAIMHFEASIAAAPDRIIARINLAAALLFDGRTAESIEVSRAATIFTSHLYPYLLLSSALAKRDGKITEAAKILELGLGLGSGRNTIGEDENLEGKTVLIKLLMGAGDIIIALPAIEKLAKRGARVLLHVESPRDRSLECLLYRCAGVYGIVAPEDPMPQIDYYVDLYRQFLAMGAPKGTVPRLTPPLADVAAWKARLVGAGGLKVGIVWAGDYQPSWRGFRILSHVQRRCPADMFAELANIPGVSLISLQKGDPSAEVKYCGAPVLDLTEKIKDYTDTAAIIANLDLVISVDTSVAHLAGAMGKPVWILLHYDSIFFFWDKVDISSWYPTARLFRQSAPGDWDGVFTDVFAALQKKANAPLPLLKAEAIQRNAVPTQ